MFIVQNKEIIIHIKFEKRFRSVMSNTNIFIGYKRENTLYILKTKHSPNTERYICYLQPKSQVQKTKKISLKDIQIKNKNLQLFVHTICWKDQRYSYSILCVKHVCNDAWKFSSDWCQLIS
jgi:hypothetical protein